MGNCRHKHHHNHADFWTNYSAVIGGIIKFAGKALWFGQSYRLFSNNQANDEQHRILGMTIEEMVFAIVFAIFSEVCAMLAHKALNTEHQGHAHGNVEEARSLIQSDDHSAIKVTFKDLSAINRMIVMTLAIGDFISHTADMTSLCSFVFVATKLNEHFNQKESMIFFAVSTLASAGTAVADTRTCVDALCQRFGKHHH